MATKMTIMSHIGDYAERDRAVLRQLPPPLQLEAAQHMRLRLLSESEIAPVVPTSALGRLTLEPVARHLAGDARLAEARLVLLADDQPAAQLLNFIFVVLTAHGEEVNTEQVAVDEASSPCAKAASCNIPVTTAGKEILVEVNTTHG